MIRGRKFERLCYINQAPSLSSFVGLFWFSSFQTIFHVTCHLALVIVSHISYGPVSLVA